MKNSPTPAEDRPPDPEPSAPWRAALRLFDADLRRRGAAEKTRRAYAIDLGQFAAWCGAQGLEPAEVTPRTLRRYAATLSDRRAVAATVARKLAALRAFYRALREHGEVAQNPADLIPAPKRPRTLPRVLRPDEMAAVLDRIPASPSRRSTSTPRSCASRARAGRPASSRPASTRCARWRATSSAPARRSSTA